MSCDELEVLLSAWVDGETSPAETVEVERHVDGCDGCRRDAEMFRALGALVKRAADPRLDRVLAAADATARELRRRRRTARPRWLFPAVLAAAAALLLAALILAPVERPIDGGASGAALALEGGATLRLDPAARVVVRRANRLARARLVLENGTIETRVAPDGETLRIELPGGGAVELRPGAHATVRRDPATGAVTIEMLDGEATLTTGDGASRALGAGDSATVSPDGAIDAPAPTPGADEGARRPDAPAGPTAPAPGAASATGPDEVVRVRPRPNLDLLLAVRKAGEGLDDESGLAPPIPGLATFGIDGTDDEIARGLLALGGTERPQDRLGVMSLLGDIAASDELSVAARAEVVAALQRLSERPRPIERRLAARGLGAAITHLEEDARWPVRERLDALARADGAVLVRLQALLALSNDASDFARRALESAAKDPDEQVSALARALLERR